MVVVVVIRGSVRQGSSLSPEDFPTNFVDFFFSYVLRLIDCQYNYYIVSVSVIYFLPGQENLWYKNFNFVSWFSASRNFFCRSGLKVDPDLTLLLTCFLLQSLPTFLFSSPLFTCALFGAWGINKHVSNTQGEAVPKFTDGSFTSPRISRHLNSPKISAAFIQCQSHRYLFPQVVGDHKAPLIVLHPHISATWGPIPL